MKCHELHNGKRCGRVAVGYIVIKPLNRHKPLCSAHLLECIAYGVEFGPIGNLLHKQPVKPCS